MQMQTVPRTQIVVKQILSSFNIMISNTHSNIVHLFKPRVYAMWMLNFLGLSLYIQEHSVPSCHLLSLKVCSMPTEIGQFFNSSTSFIVRSIGQLCLLILILMSCQLQLFICPIHKIHVFQYIVSMYSNCSAKFCTGFSLSINNIIKIIYRADKFPPIVVPIH